MSCGYPDLCGDCLGTGTPNEAAQLNREQYEPLKECPSCLGHGEVCPSHPAAKPRVCLTLTPWRIPPRTTPGQC